MKLRHLLLAALVCTNFYYTNSSVPNVESEHILQLYQLLKDVHEVFVKNDIPYWIQGGTLLGAVRHQGQIPWDDDADFNIELSNEQKFLSLRHTFNKLGYDIYRWKLGYKVYVINGRKSPKRPDAKFRLPCVDIFLTITHKNKVYYDPSRNVHWMHRNNGPIYIRNKELYPLKKYQFGEIKLYGPHDPIPFLDACYSKDWRTHARKWNHLTYARETVILQDSDKLPAQPTGPLVNRVK